MAPTNRPTSSCIDVPDIVLPALLAALSLARNRALICGQPRSQEAFEALRLQVLALVPDFARPFDPTRWSEIALAVADGLSVTVSCRRPPFWKAAERGMLTVVVEPDPASGLAAIEASMPMPAEDAESVSTQISDYFDSLTPIPA